MDIENHPLNHRVFYSINHSRHPLLDVFYMKFYLLGKGWFAVFVGFLIFLLGDRELLLRYAGVLTLQSLVVKILKYTVRAKRPSAVLKDVYNMEGFRLKSFPSGDAAMAVSIALSLFSSFPDPLKPLLILYPILIGYGRVYMGAHFPLDVLAGWLIGVVCFTVVSFLF